MFRKLITLTLILLPVFVIGQTNVKLMMPANGAGYTVYTGADGRQAYHKLDSLVATMVSPANSQLLGLSDLVTGGQNTGVLLELSDFGGEVNFRNGDNISITRNLNEIVISGTAPTPTWANLTGVPTGFADGVDNDTNTQLSTEQVQDAIGTMFAGNTETGISVTYDDTGNELDFVVAPSWTSITGKPTIFNGAWANLTGVPTGFADGVDNDTNTQLSTEQVQDAIGTMFAGNTETGISVTYDDAGNEIDFVVDGDGMGVGFLVQKSGNSTTFNNDNGVKPILRLGENMTYTSFDNGRSVQIDATDTNTQLSTEQVQDAIGTMFAGNTETGISVTYDDTGNELDFVVAPSWTSITGKPTIFNGAWANLTGIPTGFADGVDNNTTYSVGTGLDFFGTRIDLDFSEFSIDNTFGSSSYFIFEESGVEKKASFTTLRSWFSDGNTQLSTEQVQDAIGTMLSGNTESGISVNYDDASNEIDFVVTGGSDGNNYPTSFTTINNNNILTLNRNGLSPIVTDLSPLRANWNLLFNMPSGFADGVDNNTTYSVGTGLDFFGTRIDLDFSEFSIDNTFGSSSYFIFEESGVEKKASFTTLRSWFSDGNTQLSTEQVQDAIGTMFSGNTESGISVNYDDASNEIDFVVTGGASQNALYRINVGDNTSNSLVSGGAIIANSPTFEFGVKQTSTGAINVWKESGQNSIVITHANTSNMNSLSNNANQFVSGLNVDGYGHTVAANTRTFVQSHEITNNLSYSISSTSTAREHIVAIRKSSNSGQMLFLPTPTATLVGVKVHVYLYALGTTTPVTIDAGNGSFFVNNGYVSTTTINSGWRITATVGPHTENSGYAWIVTRTIN